MVPVRAAVVTSTASFFLDADLDMSPLAFRYLAFSMDESGIPLRFRHSIRLHLWNQLPPWLHDPIVAFSGMAAREWTSMAWAWGDRKV
jgi:hypothetical protein